MQARVRRRQRAVACALLALLVASAAVVGCQRPPSDGPPMPFEDEGACPFENCRYGEWTVEAGVAVKTDRWIGAPVLFRLRKGDRAAIPSGVVVTHRPGRVRFRKAVDVSTSTGSLRVEPGETLYLLTSHGGGVTTVWFKGRVYRDVKDSDLFSPACERSPEACNATLLAKPLHGWWVQVRNAKGLVGWTNEPQKFGRQNALGS